MPIDNASRARQKELKRIRQEGLARGQDVKALRDDLPGQGKKLQEIEDTIAPFEIVPPNPNESLNDRVQALMDELADLRP